MPVSSTSTPPVLSCAYTPYVSTFPPFEEASPFSHNKTNPNLSPLQLNIKAVLLPPSTYTPTHNYQSHPHYPVTPSFQTTSPPLHKEHVFLVFHRKFRSLLLLSHQLTLSDFKGDVRIVESMDINNNFANKRRISPSTRRVSHRLKEKSQR